MSDAKKVLVKLRIFEDPQVVGVDELVPLASEGLLLEVIGDAPEVENAAYDPERKLLESIPGIEKVRPDLVKKSTDKGKDGSK